MRQQTKARKLLKLSGWLAIAGLTLYISVKFVIPSLFPYWGVGLVGVLGAWAATSTWVLLANRPRTIRLLVVIVFITASLVGGILPWGGLAGFVLILMAFLVLVGITLLLVFLSLGQKQSIIELLLLGYVPMLAGVIMVAIANLITFAPPALSIQAHSPSDELRYMFETDQQDRLTSRMIFDSSRDQARLKRTLSLDRQGLIAKPEAQYYAALILQHGTCPEHFRRAYQLAHGAAKAGIPQAEWLSHASYDRWMISEGQPQKYNTQLILFQKSTCNT
ncbi:hypothetical protein H6G96_33005 [Nostoc sp. FACHB-892]|uniref:hypothetical protein n=1 Tax=Nostoc sp. FACHB-892 TaxID=2692843 RepID=UPI0016861048|nr:hypothetical protein [Nostoc sp. FACHB-892]MBD2731007.1 hypothetical protein [Nostoc sp. FACHB-892]